MRRIFVLLFVAAFFTQPLHAGGHEGTLAQIKQSGKVRIGFRENQPPMSFVDKSGKPAGYSIDLCVRIVNEVKKTLGRDDIAVEYVPVSSTTRFPALAESGSSH